MLNKWLDRALCRLIRIIHGFREVLLIFGLFGVTRLRLSDKFIIDIDC